MVRITKSFNRTPWSVPLSIMIVLCGVSCVEEESTSDQTQRACSTLCTTIQECEYTTGFFINQAETQTEFLDASLESGRGTSISNESNEECVEVCLEAYDTLDRLKIASPQCRQLQREINLCYASLSCEQVYLGESGPFQTECQSQIEQSRQASCNEVPAAQLISELPTLVSLTADQVLCPSMSGSLDALELSIAPSINSQSPAILKPSAAFKVGENEMPRIQYLDETLMTLSIEDLVQFQRPNDQNSELMSVAFAEHRTDSAFLEAVDFQPVDLNFESAQDEMDPRPPLLLMVLDQSGSLVGKIPNMPPDPTQATDFQNQRLTFFKQLIRNLSTDYAFSLITYNARATSYISKDEISNHADSASQPLLGYESLEEHLQELASATTREGGTPLKLAFKDMVSFVNDYKDEYQISILLFTDGFDEEGDTSPNQEVDLLEQSRILAMESVPVHVIELANASNEPLQDVMNASCITKGAYRFLKSADGFISNSELMPHLLTRLLGRWILKVNSSLGDSTQFPTPEAYQISTELFIDFTPEFTEDDARMTLTMEAHPESGEYGNKDNRLLILNR